MKKTKESSYLSTTKKAPDRGRILGRFFKRLECFVIFAFGFPRDVFYNFFRFL